MTQRFGGLFSPLSSRDMEQWYAAAQFIAGAVGDDDYLGVNLQTEPLDRLYETTHELLETYSESEVFQKYSPDEIARGTIELPDGLSKDETTYWYVTMPRIHRSNLERILKKIAKALHRLQNGDLGEFA